MCIICVKPTDTLFPSEQTLKNCFDNNPDGAGFMYANEGKVHYKKGYDTFKKFYDALNASRKVTGDNVPYVMHFRIATQGYNKECTHPFPLSSKMDNLKKLKGICNIGVAHNGIISLTTNHYVKDHSDTMEFITEYLSLLIRSYNWYEDAKTKALIEKLMVKSSNRLAILDKHGVVNLLGDNWVLDKETKCYFSNNTYSYKKYSGFNSYSYWDDYDDAWGADSFYATHVWDPKTRRYVKKEPAKKEASTGTGVGSNYDKWLKANTKSTAKEEESWYDKRKKECAPSKATESNKNVAPKAVNWEFWKQSNDEYAFSMLYCPYTEEDDDSFCTNVTAKHTALM